MTDISAMVKSCSS